MNKTKTFKFKSFNGYEHNPTLTREAALMIGAELIAWSQSPEEEAKPPAEPRLWVGGPIATKHWFWNPCDKFQDGGAPPHWVNLTKGPLSLIHGNIFAPPTGSRPVGDPTELDSLPLCREVDWEVE